MSTYESADNESDGAKCPTCGKECKNHRGMKIHHYAEHGESIAGYHRTCSRCGIDYYAEHRSSEYCSISCFSKDNNSGEDNPAYRGAKTTVSCEWCESDYEVWDTQVDETTFCSRVCHGEYRSYHSVGENNPNWKGGWEEYYGPNWTQQRKKCLERDGHECRGCGTTQEEHLEESGCGLHVHHVIPFRTFDDYKEANRLDNLVAACESCHHRYEGLPVFPR